jgi:DNA-binding NarL/FixJ family response regulator
MLRKRVVVIDTDDRFRFLVSSIIKLSDKFTVVADFSDLNEALKQIPREKPDIIITDLYYPGSGPIEYLKRLLDKTHLVDILVISESYDQDIILEAISHGAIGYLVKKDVPIRLLDSLEWITRGGSPLDFLVARKLINNIQIARATPLTRQESSVLKLITQGKTYAMIAEELHISNETSRTHIRNIYRKLNVNSKTEAVRKAISDRLVQIV